MTEAINLAKEALQAAPCKCKKRVETDKCPQCGEPLRGVGHGPIWMNSEQWDATKAGDFYCVTCKDLGTNTGYKYFYYDKLPVTLIETCKRCLAIAALDPFEKAKKIRTGELDDEMPMYEEITGWFQRVPVTYLPGLLITMVQICIRRNVFKEGGLEKVISQAKLRAVMGSELRSENT